jgi:hypothetical protein
MSKENRQIARRFIEALAGGRHAGLSEIVAEDVVDHNPRPGRGSGCLQSPWRSLGSRSFPSLGDVQACAACV